MGNVFPARGAHEEPGNPSVAPVAVDERGDGNEACFRPVTQHDARDHALDLENIHAEEEQLAHGLFRRTENLIGRLAANHDHTAVIVDVFPGERFSCHHFHGKCRNEQIIDAVEKRAHGTLAVRRMQVEPLGVAAADAHGRDALELADSVNTLLLEHSFRLSRVLGILHENAHDVDAAHENHVLADLVADLLSQHCQGNEGRNAKGDGKDNAITFLACDLAQGDAQEIGIGNHIGENPPLCSWIEAPRQFPGTGTSRKPE